MLGASKDDRGHLVGWCELYRARRGNVGEGRRGGRMECMAHVLRGMQCGDVGRFGWTSAPTRV